VQRGVTEVKEDCNDNTSFTKQAEYYACIDSQLPPVCSNFEIEISFNDSNLNFDFGVSDGSLKPSTFICCGGSLYVNNGSFEGTTKSANFDYIPNSIFFPTLMCIISILMLMTYFVVLLLNV
jgi:hypothetical protein